MVDIMKGKENKMRKLTSNTITVITVIAMVLTLTACANGNTATEAVPESTGSQTPEPTTEPTPEPEEQPHEHVWQEANYQQPKMCIECDETEGEPLSPRFLEYGFTASEHGVWVPFVTRANRSDTRIEGQIIGGIGGGFDIADAVSFKDNGEPYIKSYFSPEWREDSNIRWEGDQWILETDGFEMPLPIEEDMIFEPGFEWRIISIEAYFNCEVAYRDGWFFSSRLLDYYSIDLSTDDADNRRMGNDETGVMHTFTVYFNGNDYECKSMIYSHSDSESIYFVFSFSVPIGYDGVVLAFANAGNLRDDNSTLADVIDEDTVFFRIG